MNYNYVLVLIIRNELMTPNVLKKTNELSALTCITAAEWIKTYNFINYQEWINTMIVLYSGNELHS